MATKTAQAKLMNTIAVGDTIVLRQGKGRKTIEMARAKVNRVDYVDENGSGSGTWWGTADVKGVPYCACGGEENGKVYFEIFKQPDPTRVFIGGEGCEDEEWAGPFAFVKNFDYGKFIDVNGDCNYSHSKG